MNHSVKSQWKREFINLLITHHVFKTGLWPMKLICIIRQACRIKSHERRFKKDNANSGQVIFHNGEWTMFSFIFVQHSPVVIYRTEEKIESRIYFTYIHTAKPNMLRLDSTWVVNYSFVNKYLGFPCLWRHRFIIEWISLCFLWRTKSTLTTFLVKSVYKAFNIRGN